MEAFDKEALYDEMVYPLMKQLIDICSREGIPMFASFAYFHDPEEEKWSFCTSRCGGAQPHFERCVNIVRNGLSEDRIQSFAITTSKL